jgi:hypothetical protein
MTTKCVISHLFLPRSKFYYSLNSLHAHGQVSIIYLCMHNIKSMNTKLLTFYQSLSTIRKNSEPIFVDILRLDWKQYFQLQSKVTFL